ncbi:MAG: hypothetical protein S4CHLAM123_03610 [Chlamydiales bacterium]|nr:hypothetical protein [Chlamydiales bacterium]
MFKKALKRPIQKRSFLLFELLISLALITLCLLPLIHPHIAMRKSELQNLETIQLEQHAQTAFCSVKQKIYENREYPWDTLLNKTIKDSLVDPFYVYLDQEEPRIYTCHYTLQAVETANKNSTSKNALVLEINLTFQNQNHTTKSLARTLYLERHPQRSSV